MKKINNENLADFFIETNKNLIDGKKWYELTPSKFPQPLQDNIKFFLAKQYLKLPENKGLLGKFIFDNKLIAINDKIFLESGSSIKKIDLTLEIFLEEELREIKIRYGKDIADYIKKIRRKFNKDFYDKRIKQWKMQAKKLDNNSNNVYVLKKKKELRRTKIETLKWDLIGEPDRYSQKSNPRSPYQKEKISSESNANPIEFKRIFSKAIEEFEKHTKK